MKVEDYTTTEKIMYLLRLLNAPPSTIGYAYLVRAIERVVDNRAELRYITKNLYPTIAKEFGTNAHCVERAIRYEVSQIFSGASHRAISLLFKHTIKASTGKPTNSAFIAVITDVITNGTHHPIWEAEIH